MYGCRRPKSIGVVKVTISSVAYLATDKGDITIHVEGGTKTFRSVHSDDATNLYHEFNFGEITSDVLISLSVSDGSDYLGQIVIPIPSLLGIPSLFITSRVFVTTYHYYYCRYIGTEATCC